MNKMIEMESKILNSSTILMGFFFSVIIKRGFQVSLNIQSTRLMIRAEIPC